MPRRLRCFRPGSFWFITDRCHQERHLLRPDPTALEHILEGIRKARRASPDVGVLALITMSNHWHFILRAGNDPHGIPRFMQTLKSHVAARLNPLRERHGTFWARRYSAIEIETTRALLTLILYTLLNAVRAGLTLRSERYPGLSSLEATTGLRPAYGELDLPIEQPPDWRDLDADALARTREAMLANLRDAEARVKRDRIEKGLRTPRPERCLTIDPLSHPDAPKRTPSPPCFTDDARRERAYRERVRSIDAAYRQASLAFRNGDPFVAFPEGCFPPRAPRPFAQAA